MAKSRFPKGSKGYAEQAAGVVGGLLLPAFALGFVACSGEDQTGKSTSTGGNVATGSVSAAPTIGSVTPSSSGTSATPVNTGAAPAVTVAPPPDLGSLDASKVCPTPALNASPLRRLTRGEYTNTVHDLLGFDLDVAANFPPDESEKNGFKNNAAALTFGKAHIKEHVYGSEKLAKEAMKNLQTLAPCTAMDEAGSTACAKTFVQSFGRRAFRRATTTEDETALLSTFKVGYTGGGYAGGIEVVLRAMLQSPSFLYRLEMISPNEAKSKLVPLNGYELATRLSYALWNTTPDKELLDAAQAGTLSTKAQVAAMAKKMLSSDRAKQGLAEFYNQWLSTNRLPDVSKDATFPLFTPGARTGMQAELTSFIDYVMGANGDHKLKTLLTANVAFPNQDSASLYGLKMTGTAAQKVAPPDAQGRSGLLTLPAVLAVLAHPDQTSPVLRGAFVRAKLMCDPPPKPPDNVDITPPAPGERPTARLRLQAHLDAGDSCNGCHSLMDPIGFAFENFDSVGAYRDKENGVTIDATGEIIGSAGLSGTFVGVRAMAEKLATSEVVSDCVATQFFRYTAGRYENTADSCSLATMQDAFTKSGGDLVELLVQLTQTDAFLNRAQITN